MLSLFRRSSKSPEKGPVAQTPPDPAPPASLSPPSVAQTLPSVVAVPGAQVSPGRSGLAGPSVQQPVQHPPSPTRSAKTTPKSRATSRSADARGNAEVEEALERSPAPVQGSTDTVGLAFASIKYPSLSPFLLPQATPSPQSRQSRGSGTALAVTRVSKSSFSLKHAKERGLVGGSPVEEQHGFRGTDAGPQPKQRGKDELDDNIADESAGVLPALQLHGESQTPSRGPFRSPPVVTSVAMPVMAANFSFGGASAGGSGYYQQHYPRSLSPSGPQQINRPPPISFGGHVAEENLNFPPSAIVSSVRSAQKAYGSGIQSSTPVGLRRVLARAANKRKRPGGGLSVDTSGRAVITSSAPHSPGGGAGTAVFAGGRGTARQRDSISSMAPLNPPPIHVAKRDSILLRPQLSVSGQKEERVMRLEAINEEKDRVIDAMKSEIVSLKAVKRGLEREVEAVTSDHYGLPQRVAAMAEELKVEREKQRQLALELKTSKDMASRQQDAVIALTLSLKNARKQLVDAHQALVALQKREHERLRHEQATGAGLGTVPEGAGPEMTTTEAESSPSDSPRSGLEKPKVFATTASSLNPLLAAPLLNPNPTDQELLEEAMRFFMRTTPAKGGKNKGGLGSTAGSGGSVAKKAAVPSQPQRPRPSQASQPYYQQYPPVSPSYGGSISGPVPGMMSPYAAPGSMYSFSELPASPSLFRLSPSSPPARKQPRYNSPSQSPSPHPVQYMQPEQPRRNARVSSTGASVSSPSPSPSHLMLEEAVNKAKEQWLKERTQMMLQMRTIQGKDNLRMSRSMGAAALEKKAASRDSQPAPADLAPPAAGSKRKVLDRDEGEAKQLQRGRAGWSPVAALAVVRSPPVPMTGSLIGGIQPKPPAGRSSGTKTKRKVPGSGFVSSRRIIEVSKPSPMPVEVVTSRGTGIGQVGQKKSKSQTSLTSSGNGGAAAAASKGAAKQTGSTAQGTPKPVASSVRGRPGLSVGASPAAAAVAQPSAKRLDRVPLEDDAAVAAAAPPNAAEGESGGAGFFLTSAPPAFPVKALDFSALRGSPKVATAPKPVQPPAEPAHVPVSPVPAGATSPVSPQAQPHSPVPASARPAAISPSSRPAAAMAPALELGAEKIGDDEPPQAHPQHQQPVPAAIPPTAAPAAAMSDEEALEEMERQLRG